MNHLRTSGRTRRAFLETAASVASAGFLLQNSSDSLSAGHPADDSDEIPLVDTHQHLWDLNKQTLPWLKGSPDVLNQTYWLEEYAAATQGLNVVQAVYMEVDIHPDQQRQEAETLISICRKGNSPTVAAVISGRPASVTFAEYIRSFRQSPELKGVRQVLHSEATPQGYCLQPQFRKSVELLGELGLSYDLCMRPEDLGDGLALARSTPGTRFIVDHCGNGDPESFLSDSVRKSPPKHDPQKWRADISALADCDNVICKISGIIASAPKGVPFVESLAPLINHCLKEFGPDRVIFGGDWPVCLLGATYREWVTTLRTIVADRPIADQRKLFHANARRFYGLTVSG
jgi:L-fuconolactonase